jgi:predicted 3-demethylubiquinone-9 3-methyltransferase (glyoxalase superfamily)
MVASYLAVKGHTMQKITPFLWFDTNAEEALEFYCRVFPDAKVLERSYYPKEMPELGGQLLTGTLDLFGQRFALLNGGPVYAGFTESISFLISCDTQDEIDSYWDQLTADGGGEESQCGWLKDKFGLSWQVVPSVLERYLRDPDPEKSQRSMQAMMQMKKFDLAALTAAYEGQ